MTTEESRLYQFLAVGLLSKRSFIFLVGLVWSTESTWRPVHFKYGLVKAQFLYKSHSNVAADQLKANDNSHRKRGIVNISQICCKKCSISLKYVLIASHHLICLPFRIRKKKFVDCWNFIFDRVKIYSSRTLKDLIRTPAAAIENCTVRTVEEWKVSGRQIHYFDCI